MQGYKTDDGSDVRVYELPWMGIGKTKTVIRLARQFRPTPVVVMPKSLAQEWNLVWFNVRITQMCTHKRLT